MASRNSVRIAVIIDQIDKFGGNDRCHSRSSANTKGTQLNSELWSEELRVISSSS